MTIQQGGHALYPAHVQYVDGNDPSIYASTNGQMYELTKTRCAACGAVIAWPVLHCILTPPYSCLMLHISKIWGCLLRFHVFLSKTELVVYYCCVLMVLFNPLSAKQNLHSRTL